MRVVRNHRLTPAGKALVLILTLWGLAVIVPDFWRVFVTFGTIGIQANNDGVIYTDPNEPAASHGIKKGDRIDLRRMACPGALCGDLLSVLGGMGGLHYVRLNDAVTLDVIKNPCTDSAVPAGRRGPPGGGPGNCAFTVTLNPLPYRLSPATKVTLLLDELFGVFFILLAGALLWQRPSAMTWAFFLYGLWLNPGQTFVAYAYLQQYPVIFILQEAAQGLAQAAGYIGFVVFALRFPQDTIEPRWRFAARALPYVGVGLVLLQVLSFGTTFGFRTGAVTRASYLVAYAIDLAVVILLCLRLRSQTLQDRQRTRWVIWSCFIGLPAFILADSVSSTSLWGSWSPSEATVNLLYLLNAGIAVAVYHAVRRHRVIDVRFAFSRAATLLATWIIVGILIGLAGRALEHRFIELRVQEALLVVLVVGLTLIFEKLHEWLNTACDGLFFRHLHQEEQRLRQAGLTLALAESPEGIEQLLVSETVTTLRLEAAAIFRHRSDGAFERRAPGINWPEHSLRRLSADDPLVARLKDVAKPVRLERLDWSNDSLPSGAQRPTVAVPIMNYRLLVAIGFYGAHTTGDDLNAEEVSMLADLAREAASAYDHVEVKVLRRQLEELRQRL